MTQIAASGGGHPLEVGVIWWQPEDGVAAPLSAVLRRMGYSVLDLDPETRWPVSMDVLIVHGPMGPMCSIESQLRERCGIAAPFFVFWHTEQFPRPRLPLGLRNLVGDLRGQFDRLARWRQLEMLERMNRRAIRFRYLSDLRRIHRAGMLDLLVVSSAVTARQLVAEGFDAVASPVGLAPGWSADLDLERDIPVLWLGKVGSRRRARMLDAVEAGLSDQGIELCRIDGERGAYVFGDERTQILNRSRVVLNLLRKPWDDNSRRLFLAAANRALIVSEPMLPHTSFEPGKHYIEASGGPSKIVDAIVLALREPERNQDVEAAAYRLCEQGYTMRATLTRVMAEVERRLSDGENGAYSS